MRLFILLLIFPNLLCAQLTISGTTEIVSYHQGGAMLADEYKLPKPYKTELYVISFKDSLTIPKVVVKFETDDQGNFSISLPPGKYGFVTPEEIERLEPGQLLPKSTEIWSTHTYSSTGWYANINLPIELSGNPVKNVVLTYSSTSGCMTCP